MSQKIILLISALLGLAVLTGADMYDYDEDLNKEYLQLQINENRILAFSGKKPPVSVDLDVGEEVRSHEEEGYVGAVLTNRRFLAISSLSGEWLSEPLLLGEENIGDITVGEKVAMLVTERRVVGFTYRRDRFVKYQIPVGDLVIAKDAGENYGVVVMSDRAAGLSSETGDFNEIIFDIDETFRSLETATTFATIDTDLNIYSYRGSSGTWSTRPKSDVQ